MVEDPEDVEDEEDDFEDPAAVRGELDDVGVDSLELLDLPRQLEVHFSKNLVSRKPLLRRMVEFKELEFGLLY